MQERLRAQRGGLPFFVLRDGDGEQLIVPLADEADQLVIGRGRGSDIRVDWDKRVSSVHADLQRVGDQWLLADDGLSRNGTTVNGRRISERRRLRDGDQVVVGDTMLVFSDPASERG